MPIRITGMNSGLDTEAIITELMSAHKMKGDKLVKEQTKLSWKQDAWKSLNTKIFNFYKKTRSMTLSSGYSAKKCTVSDPTKATVTANSSAMNGTQTLKVTNTAKSGYLTGGQLKESVNGSTTLDGLEYFDTDNNQNVGFEASSTTLKIVVGKGGGAAGEGRTVDVTVKPGTTIDEFVKQFNDAFKKKEDGTEDPGPGVELSFDAENRRFFLASQATGEAADFKIESVPGDKTGENLIKMLGLSEDRGAKKVNGEDAKIELNGVEYTSSTNSFNVNGLTINTLAKTDGEISINTENDVQGVYDKIKEFLTDYNDLMKEMYTLFNADSSKGYDPLTSEEKDAMSDTDIEAWEDKIKGSLLRRDGQLGGVMNAMTSSMLSTYDINGKSYGLSTFGIMTMGYFDVEKNERNMYHINGDPDDEDVADKEDKLKAALQEDPDTVIQFFQKLSSSLYSNLDEKMKRTELSSIYTVYNDKEMATSYSDFTDRIRAWEDKMTAIEDSYYKKFSAMETALAKLQSQTSSLSSLFG